MKNYNGTVIQTVRSIRTKAVGILAVFLCVSAVVQEAQGQCSPTPFSVKGTPSVTGTAGAVGTKYRYTNVLTGVDVEMQIDSLINGVALSTIDSIGTGTSTTPAGSGYDNAWQPTLIPTGTAAGKDGYIRWKISFFANGTNNPYFFNCISLLAVDIDGDGDLTAIPVNNGSLREYVEAYNPYSFAGQSNGTHLSYNAASGFVRATAATVQVIQSTDSTKKQAMSLFRFKNLTSFKYTTGYTKTTTGNSPNRQFCLFFNVQTTFPSGFSRYYDTDNDGVGGINGAGDLDDDNDGIPDLSEYPSSYADPLLDADSDGLANYEDPTPGTGVPSWVDSNGDGVNDKYDIDLDGIINSLDLDADGDGIPDIVEAGGVDTNGDGLVDTFIDANSNGLADVYDAAATGGIAIRNLDTDGDGIPNARDLDSDNDGIPDVLEAGGADTNNDGKLDNSSDVDGDGLADIVDGDVGNDDTAENTANALIITSAAGSTAGQPASYPRANLDNSGLPNPYDLDSDNDGIVDTRESGIAPTGVSYDTNNDGVINSGDTNYADANGDGWADAIDALSSFTLRNTDGIGNPNYLDIDSDDDGIPDNIEAQATSSYVAPTGLDTDGDGVDNAYDTNSTFGVVNNGITTLSDVDGDGISDYRDLDSDNDGKLDRLEGWDTNGNNTIDGSEKAYASPADADGDGLLDVYDAVVNSMANAATNITNNTTPTSYPDKNNPGGDRDWRQAQDTDKDGIPDATDLDDDNDGITDAVECPNCTTAVFQNGSFELPTQANGVTTSSAVPGWGTTAQDNMIEIWRNTTSPAPAAGVQFVELNANYASTLYQNFCLNGNGATIIWSIKHRGRAGIDSASVGFGTAVNALDRVAYMVDGNTAWGSYSGSYTVPAGITNIFMGLTAIRTATGDLTVGNFVDDVQITIYQPSTCDTDGDGIPDTLDLDSDGDGIPDIVEAGGIDANGDGRVDTFVDLNNNGLADTYDPAATVPGTSIANLDTDGDGIPNAKDLDSDNDGIADVTEAGGTDANYDGKLDNTTDTDGDGLSDLVDGDVGNDGTAENTAGALIITSTTGTNGRPTSYTGANADANGLPNPYDLDSDDDGIPDLIEAGGIDSNGDGRIDATTDANGNGWRDFYDPTNGGINLRTIDANGATAGGLVFDFDGDGIANYLDLDSDNDGIPDIIEQGGADTNNNGKVDGTADVDGDGFLDLYDPINNSTAATLGTAIITTGSTLNTFNYPSTYSTGDNQDGMGLINMLDLDADGDGITDVKEAGFAESGTTPGFAAGTLGTNGWSTTVSGSTVTALALPNTDGRGPVNYLDIDSDDDGITDNVEGQATYSYKLPLGTDTDADGIDDAYDALTSVGGAGIVPVNTDNTDVADYLDLDSDNDGVSDLKEGWGDPQFSLTAAEQTADADGDGLLDKFDSFNMASPTSAMLAAMQSNVTMKNMGANGVVPSPLPTLFGSMDRLYKSSTIPTADRDWRNFAIILPVKLISFTASYSNKVSTINWTTTNETAHERYVVERSIDGTNFTALTTVAARGNNGNYTYNDNTVPAVNVVYYRLQMVDESGNITYSRVVAIRLNGDKMNLSIYPNPVVDVVTVSFASTTAQAVTIKVYNAQGAQVMTKAYKAQVGTNTLQLTDWNILPNGDYLIEVGNETFRLTHKLSHVH